jgi:SAM-dependent methyltransferase
MHKTALENGSQFFKVYSHSVPVESNALVVDIGAQDVNGSLRSFCPSRFRYLGVDFQHGKSVDVVLEDPYSLPFPDNTVDIVVSSSCFEHSEMFWLSFIEILRILKPHGLFYLNVPSDGGVHRFPVDCWRFYPDAGDALVSWARKQRYDPVLLESFVQRGGGWCDFISVFLKDKSLVRRYEHRILHSKRDFENGKLFGNPEVLNAQSATQNERSLRLPWLLRVLRSAIKTRVRS